MAATGTTAPAKSTCGKHSIGKRERRLRRVLHHRRREQSERQRASDSTMSVTNNEPYVDHPRREAVEGAERGEQDRRDDREHRVEHRDLRHHVGAEAEPGEALPRRTAISPTIWSRP